MPKDNYPLHPGQTHVQPLYTQIPLEEYEHIMNENRALKQANKNLTESIAELEQMKQKEVELDMKESRLKLQEKELKEKGVYINYWIDNEVEKPSKEYAGCNFAVTNGLQVLLAVWGGSKWFDNPFEYMRQNKITHWYRLPKLPENPKPDGEPEK